MDDQTKQLLLDYLKQAVQAGKDQIPLVCGDLIRAEIIYRASVIFIFALSAFSVWFICHKVGGWAKAERLRPEEDRDEKLPDIVIAQVFCFGVMLICLAVIFYHFVMLVMVVFAPRAYLLDYFMRR